MLATGVDIVAIERFNGKAADAAFLERLLTENEAAEVGALPHAERQIAVRFAAKEAVMKALGTGWDKGVGWRDIEVVTAFDAGGTAGRGLCVTLHGRAKALAKDSPVFLSVSHTNGFAAAFAIMEGPDEVPDNNPRL
ncbi:MAG: holo-ACP synthase [Deltaproteobacteria bacterium]|nr:holo-ACP synthase [Deltaproteobacteria bacterium]